MKGILFLSLLSLQLFSSQVFSAEYLKSGIWTGGNQFSSAPTPSCPCDIDSNTIDCSDFSLEKDRASELGKVCYDEFLPSKSRGWAHGIVFKQSN